jgi:Cytochrome P450
LQGERISSVNEKTRLSAAIRTTTPRRLLDQAIHALLTHPQQFAHVRAGRVGWGEVIEEALRCESPVAHVPLRYAVEDIDLGSVVIRKGEAILASYAAVGRDPKLHGPTADSFDVTRWRSPPTSSNPSPASSPTATAYCRSTYTPPTVRQRPKPRLPFDGVYRLGPASQAPAGQVRTHPPASVRCRRNRRRIW